MRTSRRFLLPVLVALVVGLGVLAFLRRGAPPSTVEAPAPAPPVVAALRGEPRSFNRLAVGDRASAVVAFLVHARLVQLNHRTQELEPALATSWTLGPDRRTYTLALRQGVTFSDGAPFTADDVVFTFDALYDPKSEGPLTSSLKIDGKPIAARKTGPHTVVLTLPAPYGPGLRLLNALPILPAHKLRDALANGTFAKAWPTTTPPAEIVGLGPYTIRGYTAGDRVELVRNPRYGARGPDVRPGVERLTLRIIPTQDAERLGLEAGEIDLPNGEIRPDDLKAMRVLAATGRIRLHDLGPALDPDALWFHLGPDARKPAAARPWLSRAFRQAAAHAVDRTAFVNTVYLGAGVPGDGPITAGNKAWHAAGLPTYAFDLAKARALFAEAGLKDSNGDGQFETAPGKPLRVELLTQRGHAVRERGAAVLASDLEEAGVGVDVVPLDLPALIERLQRGTYDAVYFAISSSDTDPSANLDYWLSTGSFHVWHPRQAKPATAWEAEVDTLMHELTGLTDARERQTRFARVQQIFATELPVIVYAVPSLTTATSARVGGLEPGAIYPFLLWRADTMRLASAR